MSSIVFNNAALQRAGTNQFIFMSNVPASLAGIVLRPPCPKCGAQDYYDDTHTGDSICRGCGLVAEEHVVDDTAEWRVIADDEDSKQRSRVGAAINPFSVYDVSTSASSGLDQRHRDDQQFLRDGKRNIDAVIPQLFEGNENERIRSRAIEIFEYGYRFQQRQKHGKQKFEATKGVKKKTGQRQKYARRKAIAVAAVYQALRELSGDIGIKRVFSIADVSGNMEGRQDVTEESVRRVLEEIQPELPGIVRTTNLQNTIVNESLPEIKQVYHDYASYPRCAVCRGFGKDLLQASGMCAHCERLSGVAEKALPSATDPFLRCSRCGGFGLHLVKANGMCDHCTRSS